MIATPLTGELKVRTCLSDSTITSYDTLEEAILLVSLPLFLRVICALVGGRGSAHLQGLNSGSSHCVILCEACRSSTNKEVRPREDWPTKSLGILSVGKQLM